MSLRYQINLGLVATLFLVLLLGGGAMVFQARQAVTEELKSSIHLALQLLTLGINKTQYHTLVDDENLQNLLQIKQTRHLDIALRLGTGKTIQLTKSSVSQNMPPDWFTWAIARENKNYVYPINTEDGRSINILIKANALDEIYEAWSEVKVFLSIILALMLGLFIAVNLLFRQILIAIDVILQKLSDIETGNYQHIPTFKASELAKIADAINHLTSSLEKTKRENAALTLHSLEIQEIERKRLAQELHDELGQSLTAIKVMAVAAKTGDSQQNEVCNSMLSLCDHLFGVVRSMMKNLHPLMLTELGLNATLEDLILHWQARIPHLKIQLKSEQNVDNLEAKIAIQIFRIIQEAITNTVRHAQASTMKIQLDIINSQLNLDISDNGIGCEMSQFRQGFGLLGVQARVDSLGGIMKMQTASNQGMEINVQIPLFETANSDFYIKQHEP